MRDYLGPLTRRHMEITWYGSKLPRMQGHTKLTDAARKA